MTHKADLRGSAHQLVNTTMVGTRLARKAFPVVETIRKQETRKERR
ncbi:hypothetical protein [Kibdelosporangium philippinense]